MMQILNFNFRSSSINWPYSVHMCSHVSSGHRLAITSLRGMLLFSGIGVGVGLAMRVTPLRIIPGVRSYIISSPGWGGSPIPLVANGQWYEANLPTMHEDTFFSELISLLTRSLQPLSMYAIQIQPSSATRTITLGSQILINNEVTLQWLEEYFMPILAQMEEDYHEVFGLDREATTLVKIRYVGPQQSSRLAHPLPSTSSASASLRKMTKPNMLNSNNSQQIISATKNSRSTYFVLSLSQLDELKQVSEKLFKLANETLLHIIQQKEVEPWLESRYGVVKSLWKKGQVGINLMRIDFAWDQRKAGKLQVLELNTSSHSG